MESSFWKAQVLQKYVRDKFILKSSPAAIRTNMFFEIVVHLFEKNIFAEEL